MALMLPLTANAQEALSQGPLSERTPTVVNRGGDPVSLTQNAETSFLEGGTVACAVTDTPYTTENQYLRVFNLGEEGPGSAITIDNVDIGVAPGDLTIAGSVETQINFYTMSGGIDYTVGFSYDDLTLVSSSPFTVNDGDALDIYSVDLDNPASFSATDTLVVEFAIPDGSVEGEEFGLRPGANEEGSTQSYYLATLESCGPIPPTEVGEIGDFAARQWVIVLNGFTGATASEGAAAPQRVTLGQSYPNPAVGRVVVPFSLEESQRVRVAVYDALGREVAVAADEAFAAGEQSVEVDVSGLPTGLYIYRVTASDQTFSRKMVVLQ